MGDEKMNKIGKAIKDFRVKVGLKQEELAVQLGKSKSVISNWERGDNMPDVVSVEKMCNIFGITPNDFYDWKSGDEDMQILHRAKRSMPEDEFERMMMVMRTLAEKYLEDDDSEEEISD